MKTFDYIYKYYYEKIELQNSHNLVYLIGVNNNLKNSKGKNIFFNKGIKIFAESNKMNLISFNKNFNINELLSELENSIIEEKNKNYKNSYKVVFVGSTGIGAKTSLIENIVSNTFGGNSNGKTGSGYSTKTVKTKDGRRINLELLDTIGQETFRSLNKLCYKDSDCIVLGYDITCKSTFENIKGYWISDVKSVCNPKLMYLIGCKKDR